MTASFLKQDPCTQKVKKHTLFFFFFFFHYGNPQHANFRGNPLFQATKHLNSEKWNAGLFHANILPNSGHPETITKSR